jgi:ADP-ribose pyrophosphatase YjhB (NUDIX family)
LGIWKSEEFKLVWLEIPTSKASLVPVAVEAGFSYHHAEDSQVLLTRRLVEGAHIPPYATHYIGVGGVVVNQTKEILVVSERYRRRSRGPAYKLPGGALNPGEHIADGIVREILEETGVKTRFESLACFRQWHGYRYGKSDIYFVCRLSPLDLIISVQAEEIDECLWMPLDEFLNGEEISPFNKGIVRAAVEKPGIVVTPMQGYEDEVRFEIFMPY